MFFFRQAFWNLLVEFEGPQINRHHSHFLEYGDGRCASFNWILTTSLSNHKLRHYESLR